MPVALDMSSRNGSQSDLMAALLSVEMMPKLISWAVTAPENSRTAPASSALRLLFMVSPSLLCVLCRDGARREVCIHDGVVHDRVDRLGAVEHFLERRSIEV